MPRQSREPSDPRPAPGSSPDTGPGHAPPSRSRRCLLALAGGGLLLTSGCPSALGHSGESNASADLATRRLAFADGFDDEGWTLADYAPRDAVREGPVPVSLDDRGPSGRTPLPGGGLAPGEGSRTGPDGRFGVAWRGIARGTRSANAVCEFRPTADADANAPPFGARVSFGVIGGRGVL